MNIKKMIIVSFILVSELCILPLTAADHPAEKKFPIISSITFLENVPAESSIQSVATDMYAGRKPDISSLIGTGKEKVIWIKMIVSNPGDAVDNYIITSRYNYFQQELYSIRGSKEIPEIKRGYGNKIEADAFRLPAYSVSLAKGDNIFFIKTVSRFLLMPSFKLSTEYELKEKTAVENIIIGSLLSIFIVMTFYNLFISFFARKSYYWAYLAYLITTVLLNICYLGVGFKLIGAYAWIINDNWILWIYLNILAAVWFAASFLQFKKDERKLYWIGIGVCFIIIAGLAFSFYVPLMSIVMYNILLLSLTVSVPVIGIYRALKGFRPAIYFVIAWGFLAVSVLLFNLSIQGVITENLFFEWSYFFGAAAEMVLLSLALGDLMRFNEQKLLKKQQEYIEHLEQERKEKSHVYNQLKKIVYTHQIEWIRKGAILEDTMPVGKKDGVVIALDIVRSSSLTHAVAQEFFREFFSHCESLMLKDYNSENLYSNAYRIKEMGDGFLCSVGFPFMHPGNESKENAAYKLALDFIDDFNSTAAQQKLTGKIFCSVAIAEGELEGFYPIAGAKEYDLYGKGIILAARYEAIRKRIFSETGSVCSILSLQEKVFAALAEQYRNGFIAYSLKDCPVSEDPGAETVLYRMYPQGCTS